MRNSLFWLFFLFAIYIIAKPLPTPLYVRQINHTPAAALYAKYCQDCHDPNFHPMISKSAMIYRVRYGKRGAMPAFIHKLKTSQIKRLIAYLQS